MAILLNKPARPPAEEVAANSSGNNHENNDAPPPAGGVRRVLGVGLSPARAKNWAVFLVLFVVADIVIALVAIALVHRHSDTGPRTASGPTASARSAPTAAAPVVPSSTPALSRVGPAAWMNRELPHTAGILAMGTVQTQLDLAGFGKVVGGTGVASGQVQYVVSNSALREDAKSNAVIAQLLAYSAPIAAFGSGSDRIEVRQVTTTPDSSRKAHHGSGVMQRADQERQLLQNKALTFNADGARILRAGGLDLRAASVLALLAGSTPLRVQVVTDPAERAAGVPARRVVITSDKPDVVHAVLAALPASYRLAADDHLAKGTERLVWAIDPDPAVAN